MYATLGDIVFEGLKGFSSLETKYESKIEQIARISNKPRLQQIGIAAREISLTIRLGSTYSDIRQDVQRFEDALEDAEILPFTTGDGRAIGSFVIQSMTKTDTRTTVDGIPLWVDIELTLIEEPNTETPSFTASQAIIGLGIEGGGGILGAPVQGGSNISDAARGLSNLQADNTAQINRINEIENNPDTLTGNANSIAQTAAQQESDAGTLDAVIGDITTLSSQTAALRVELSNSQALFQALRQAARARDVTALKTLRGDLISLNTALENLSVGLVVLNALRL